MTSDLISIITKYVSLAADYAWGIPTVVILVGTGIYLTIRMGFIQIRGFKHSVDLVDGKFDNKEDPGEVSHFQALSTALSATIGTGNIAGVATAIAIGGPGALFWMWVTAIFGMATKFTSCTLSLKYRKIHPDGKVSGGPMYTILNGLNMPKLAAIFAIFALIASFGIGNMVQANSVVNGLGYILSDRPDHALNTSYNLIFGIIIAVGVGVVIIGGVKRIAKVASLLVPIMSIFYILSALIILVIHYDQIPGAFKTIFYYAFNPYSIGGGVVGFTVAMAMENGVARGIFSNEAGLGSAPMAHAAAKTKEPIREGLVAMMEPFIDTLIICSMTGLVIVVMGIWGTNRPEALKGAELTAHAFSMGFKSFIGNNYSFLGAWVVGIGLMLFAYSTIISWSYYGDRCAEYIFGEKAILPYRMVYTLAVIIGATVPLKLVWNFADLANVLMAIPNVISLILLSTMVKKMTDEYFKMYKNNFR